MKKQWIFLLVISLMCWSLANAFTGYFRYTITEPVSGEQVVTDTVSGLIWQKSHVSSKNWQEALAYCEGLNYGGFTDWRLPNVQELSSLVDLKIHNPASDFPDMPSSSFWSSSSNVHYTSFAWSVNFLNGFVLNYFKTNTYDVRCVVRL